MASKHPARSHRWVCCCTTHHGGISWGIMRQEQPARTSQRKALNTSRKLCVRCGASSFISVRYGAQNSHSSSLTSLGYGFGFFDIPRVLPECIYFVHLFLPKS